MSTPTLSTYQQAVAKAMKERELLSLVRELAKALGYMAYHTWNSQHSEAGFPDLVLVRPPRTLFVELKTETGKLTPDQYVWEEALDRCPIENYLWRPADWLSGGVEKILL